jgi:transcriptional regulator with XRE-family HTH domain
MNMTVKQAADRLGVSTRAITKWLQAGAFPNAFKLNPVAKNSPFRIPDTDVEAFEATRHK